MTRILNVVAGLVIAASLAGQAPEATPAAFAKSAEPEARERRNMDEVICRRVGEPTGTRMQGRRVDPLCLTRREWEHRALVVQTQRREIGM